MKIKVFLPTLYEAVSLSLLGAGLMTLGLILSSLKDYDARNYNFFSTTLKSLIDKQLDKLNTPFWTVVITYGLWMICGMLLYIGIWFAATLYHSYREDSLPLHGFLTPKGYNRHGELVTVIVRAIIRVVALVMTITWIIVLLRSILPYLTTVFTTSLSPLNYRTPFTLLVSSLLLGAAVFVLIVLIRMIFLRKRIFSRDMIG